MAVRSWGSAAAGIEAAGRWARKAWGWPGRLPVPVQSIPRAATRYRPPPPTDQHLPSQLGAMTEGPGDVPRSPKPSVDCARPLGPAPTSRSGSSERRRRTREVEVARVSPFPLVDRDLKQPVRVPAVDTVRANTEAVESTAATERRWIPRSMPPSVDSDQPGARRVARLQARNVRGDPSRGSGPRPRR